MDGCIGYQCTYSMAGKRRRCGGKCNWTNTAHRTRRHRALGPVMYCGGIRRTGQRVVKACCGSQHPATPTTRPRTTHCTGAGREHTGKWQAACQSPKATYARRRRPPATVRRPRTRTWEDRPDVEMTRSSLVARSLSSRVDESSAVSRLLLSRLSRVTDGRCVRVRASAS